MRLVYPRVVDPAKETLRETPNAPSVHFHEFEAFLDRVKGLTHTTDHFPWGELEPLLRRVVDALKDSDDLFWSAVAPANSPEVDHLARHQARVAILAIRIGSTIGAAGDRLLELGMAASLCDVGLWALPGGGRNEEDRRTPADQTPDRDHAGRSADLICRWSSPSDAIVKTVLQHHERENGQGYPQGLRGKSIHPHAKIVGLADTYARLTVGRSGLSRRSLYEAIHDVMQLRQEFPPAFIKALLQEVSLFPPGTVVRLSTGEVGRVVAVNRHHPMRPCVELLRDAKGELPAEPRIIDLSTMMVISIAGVEDHTTDSASAHSRFDRRDGFWKDGGGHWR